MEETLPPLEKKSKFKDSKVANSHTSHIFRRANKFPLNQAKPTMYALGAFSKESTTDTINATIHPLRKVKEQHEVEGQGG